MEGVLLEGSADRVLESESKNEVWIRVLNVKVRVLFFEYGVRVKSVWGVQVAETPSMPFTVMLRKGKTLKTINKPLVICCRP